ncbi:DUF2818 family protein [Alcaligenes sp. SDU_A2]|uniref:DUF2818 family protein n=1 Tax=Alcaligenes sp. SDU_A2 TaxID=3136634 RepID=UPI00311F0F14
MDQSLSIWVLVVLALITANLPFFVEKPLLVLPWSIPGQAPHPAWLQLLGGVAYLAVVVALGLGIYSVIGHSSALSSKPALLGKVALVLALAAAVFYFPAWRARGQKTHKSFFSRLLEVCAFYGIVGALGFGFEASIGNPFSQTWVFYTITFALFLVLAYPGFVYRYLMRHPKGKFE